VARGDYILESLATKARAEKAAESTVLMSSTLETTRASLKVLIIEGLNLEGMTPDMIEDDQPVFGEGLGLDSIDALELMVMIEKEFGVTIEGREIDPETFRSISSLAEFVEGLRAEQGKPASA
jgi:acyl carrier protein